MHISLALHASSDHLGAVSLYNLLPLRCLSLTICACYPSPLHHELRRVAVTTPINNAVFFWVYPPSSQYSIEH